MTHKTHGRRIAAGSITPIRHVLIAAALSLSTLALPAFAQDTATEPAPQQDEATPRVRAFTPRTPNARPRRIRNVREFEPDEPVGIVPADDINLKALFEQLGPDAAQWYQHVQTLSNPFFEGRCPGTRGYEIAVEYLEFYFRQYGLEPAFYEQSGEEQLGGEVAMATTYDQPFEYRSPAPQVDVHSAKVSFANRALKRGSEFEVLGNSGSGTVTGPLAFVGYGIEHGRHDYTSFDDDTDLTGRIAILLRYEPLDMEGKSKWAERRFSSASAIRSKVNAVSKRHPAAIILVNPPECEDSAEGLETPLSSVNFGSEDFPIVQITPDVAQQIIKRADKEGRDLLQWRRMADEGQVKTQLLDPNVKITIETALTRDDEAEAQNVAGIVRGSGDLADQWIVVGGHFDHLGYGHFGSMAGAAGRDIVHPGADDNASGTAGVLILARRMKERYEAEDTNVPRRSIVFITFAGEEAGLFGSRAFTEHSPVPVENTTLMINMDMIGRLRHNELSVSGTGTAEEFDDLLPPIFAASGLDVESVATGTGPSDHTNFFRAGIPVLFLFTGMHDQYHSPQDQAWTVNPAGAMKVLKLAEDLTWEFAHREEGLTYKEAAAGRGQDRGYARVRLGVRPDMAAELDAGILVQEVSEGTSADKAGIQPGDILLEWNGTGLLTMRDLFEALQSQKPGDVVKVKVQRGEDILMIPVTLQASSGGG